MVAVKAGGVDAFLAKPPSGLVCALFYGPDAGLVSERAALFIKTAVPGLDEGFGLIRLEGDDLASDPSRLLDEAHAISMFGGARVLRIKGGSRAFHAAIDGLLGGPPPEALTVVEAGDLRKGAPLRALCERSPKAAAIPCFADNDAAIGRLIDAALSAAGVQIDRDARTMLLGSLGADRLATRGEIDKLLLYAHGAPRLTVSDIEALMSDTSATAADDLVDAAFAGDVGTLDEGLTKLALVGTSPSQILGAALRHLLQLHRLRCAVEAGAAPGAVLDREWPQLHFRRRPLVERALTGWNLERLTRLLGHVSSGILEARRGGSFGEVLARRIMLEIGSAARSMRR
jgi:DNA polymerase-3 subunit delta